MLDEEEHFQEQMFERHCLYGERNKEPDFWLVTEPKLLDKFPNITKRLKRPIVALVSTNGPWITFMKLRLDRVLQESYEADSIEEALACTPVSLEFEKLEKWTAPYPKYEYGWWESSMNTGGGSLSFPLVLRHQRAQKSPQENETLKTFIKGCHLVELSKFNNNNILSDINKWDLGMVGICKSYFYFCRGRDVCSPIKRDKFSLHTPINSITKIMMIIWCKISLS